MAADIQPLLRANESENLEFKQSLGEIREIIEQVSATMEFIQRHISMAAETSPHQSNGKSATN